VRWVVPNLLDTALSYLRKGWSIFPLCSPIASYRCLQHRQCGNPGKVPLLSWKQYQTGLPTTDDVYRWWSAWPESGIGLATGYRSGVVVLDLDGADALRDAGRHGDISRCPNFPTTPSALQTSLHGSQNAFVSKMNSTGSALSYSTYLGDSGSGI